MTHISQIVNKPQMLTYYRKPTKEEIKFGYGAIHYRDFPFEKCFDKSGFQKLRAKAIDDGHIYHYASTEWFITKKSKIETIDP